jgi:hypothetical protein
MLHPLSFPVRKYGNHANRQRVSKRDSSLNIARNDDQRQRRHINETHTYRCISLLADPPKAQGQIDPK